MEVEGEGVREAGGKGREKERGRRKGKVFKEREGGRGGGEKDHI